LFEFLRVNKDRLKQVTAFSRGSVGCSQDSRLRFEEQQLLCCLQELFEKMTADDFNVSKADVLPGVGYQEVYSGPEMTICLFTLSAGSRLPLHDHPDMHVFGRLLLGRLRVTSYDLVPEPEANEANEQWPREVMLEGDVLFETAPVTFSLGPDRGNPHDLLALEDCAFFDVLFPPYDSAAGRHCTYFNHWVDSTTGRHYVTPEQPWGFSMRQRPYRGPPFPI
jgi:cysteamine dioxygenase